MAAGDQATPVLHSRRRAAGIALVGAGALVVTGVVVFLLVSRSAGTTEVVVADRSSCVSLGGAWSTGGGAGGTCTIRAPRGGLTIGGPHETVVVPRQTRFYVYGSVVNRGTFVIRSCCSLDATGIDSFVIWGPGFRNEGVLWSSAEFGIYHDATFVNDGTLLVNRGGPGLGSGGTILNRADGRIVNRGVIEFHPPGGLTNLGRFVNRRGASLTFDSIGPNGPGTTALRNSGRLANAGSISASSVVVNRGVIRETCGARFADTARKQFTGVPVRAACPGR